MCGTSGRRSHMEKTVSWRCPLVARRLGGGSGRRTGVGEGQTGRHGGSKPSGSRFCRPAGAEALGDPRGPAPTPPFSAAVIFTLSGPHSSSSLNYDSQAARPHPSCCHPALPGRLAALISNGHQAAPASLCVRAGDPQLLCSPSSALSLRATQADLLLKTKGSRFRRRPHRTTCPVHLALSLRRPGVLHRAPPACHRRVRVPSV